jgi:hypothetical protein
MHPGKDRQPEHPEARRALNNLAHQLADEGDFGAAEPMYRWAIEARKECSGRERFWCRPNRRPVLRDRMARGTSLTYQDD